VEFAQPPRIVSCIASATEIVHALGLGDYQVGRSHECDWPPEVLRLPVCTQPRFDVHGDSEQIDQRVRDTLLAAGSVYQIDHELVDRLRPTHVLTQTQCKVCAVSLKDVEDSLQHLFQSRPQVVALEPNSLQDIWRDIQRVADGCGIPEKGQKLSKQLLEMMRANHSKASSSRTKPGVVCIEWPKPIMVAGNWIPELIELANGNSLLSKAGSYSPSIHFAELLQADPEVIVMMPCGYGLARSREESHWLTEIPEWKKLQAVQNDKVYITDANQYMTRPGPRVEESLLGLCEILHPDIFLPTLENEAWQRL
jgi:iron complex transport system substrate-binding protein